MKNAPTCWVHFSFRWMESAIFILVMFRFVISTDNLHTAQDGEDDSDNYGKYTFVKEILVDTEKKNESTETEAGSSIKIFLR